VAENWTLLTDSDPLATLLPPVSDPVPFTAGHLKIGRCLKPVSTIESNFWLSLEVLCVFGCEVPHLDDEDGALLPA
jgi:hypothetical protein